MSKLAILSLLGGIGVTGAVAIPVTFTVVKNAAEAKAKDALDGFLPFDPANYDLGKEKLKYVAIGDSITSGYNGYMGKDYFSFADGLALSMNKLDNLSTYKNFGVAGATISDLHNDIARDSLLQKSMEDADLVTISIGANDLLKGLKIYDVPYTEFFNAATSYEDDSYRESNEDFNPEGDSVHDKVSKTEKVEKLKKLFDQLVAGAKTNKWEDLFSIIPEWRETLFDGIERDMLVLLRDLTKVSKNARVEIVVPPFPFVNLPKEVYKSKDEAGMSISDYYQKFIDTLQKVTDRAAFAELFDGEKVISEKTETIIKRALPNHADIHPSTFGHGILANKLTEKLFPAFNNAGNKKLDDIYTNITSEAGYDVAIKDEQYNLDDTNYDPSNDATWIRNYSAEIENTEMDDIMSYLLNEPIDSEDKMLNINLLENLFKIDGVKDFLASLLTGDYADAGNIMQKIGKFNEEQITEDIDGLFQFMAAIKYLGSSVANIESPLLKATRSLMSKFGDSLTNNYTSKILKEAEKKQREIYYDIYLPSSIEDPVNNPYMSYYDWSQANKNRWPEFVTGAINTSGNAFVGDQLSFVFKAMIVGENNKDPEFTAAYDEAVASSDYSLIHNMWSAKVTKAATVLFSVTETDGTTTITPKATKIVSDMSVEYETISNGDFFDGYAKWFLSGINLKRATNYDEQEFSSSYEAFMDMIKKS